MVDACREGTHPSCVGQVKSGWVIMGQIQVIPGYCLLLPDPVVPHLNALQGTDRCQFLDDMADLGEVVLQVTKATRINYEMLGNLEPALHAHVFPRFDSEPEGLKTKPIWMYDWDSADTFSMDQHGELFQKIQQTLFD
jgi:diadenosine tetraphosphate (Ap4A) HIT family hydrolase